MDWTVTTYLAYLALAVPLTAMVGVTLSRNGRVFLEEVFAGSDGLARAVNKLLVVGFYLLAFGFVSLMLRVGTDVPDLRGLIEALSVKLGVVALVLGVVHAGDVYVVNAMRRHHRAESRRLGTAAPHAGEVGGYYGPVYPAPGR